MSKMLPEIINIRQVNASDELRRKLRPRYYSSDCMAPEQSESASLRSVISPFGQLSKNPCDLVAGDFEIRPTSYLNQRSCELQKSKILEVDRSAKLQKNSSTEENAEPAESFPIKEDAKDTNNCWFQALSEGVETLAAIQIVDVGKKY